MKKVLFVIACFAFGLCCQAEELVRLVSPNAEVSARVQLISNKAYIDVYRGETRRMTRITLGLTTNEGAYTNLHIGSVGDVKTEKQSYTAVHGKTSQVNNEATTVKVRFLNAKNSPLDVEVCAWNDGVTFRYSLPSSNTPRTFTSESTAYQIEQSDHRWLMGYTASYEGDFEYQGAADRQGDWAYPCLFQHRDDFMLITEANASRQYCNTHLNNWGDRNSYVTNYPSSWEGNGQGDVNPSWNGAWTSPWRVVIVGTLQTLVASTLVEDCSDPTTMTDLSWVKPGGAAWVYWAYNSGTRDFQICKQYVDLAATMGWPYVLFDAEWDSMYGGGNIQDACKYALSKGVKPLLWYNSGGSHNNVYQGPRDRMTTHENRVKEFNWLKGIGAVGVKIDFFESDKQNMVSYYLDILEDARDAKVLVNFHGATIPRGWTRTYPHLMTTEGVFGAEQYNNGGHMTDNAPRINCTFPFTRNVVGPMDYTPVAFTNSQHPHTTSFAHEVALSVVFESGIQHWADRPEGFYALPNEPKKFMKEVPTAWDETRLLDGYPGQFVIMARRKGNTWYVGGLEGQSRATTFDVKFDFLNDTTSYFLVLNADGATSSTFKTTYHKVKKDDVISVPCLSRGGFAMSIKPESEFGYADLLQLRKDVTTIITTAKTTKATTQGYYEKSEIALLQEALTENKVVTITSSAEEILAAYYALQQALSRFESEGYITGGPIHHKEMTQNVTAKYLVEARMFSRAEGDNVARRFGKPLNWTVENFYVDNGNNGVKEGIDTYTGSNSLSLGVWDDSSNAQGDLRQCKLYRTVYLPKGKYFLGGNYNSNLNLENAYLFAARLVPSAGTVVAKSISCTPVSNLGSGDGLNGITFSVATDSAKIILGWVADLSGNGNQEFRASEIQLLRYLDAEEAWITSEAASVTHDQPLYVSSAAFAESGDATYAWGPKHEGVLKSNAGTILTVGQIDLTGIDAITIHGNLSGTAQAGSKLEIILDNAETLWTTVPAFKRAGNTVLTTANLQVPGKRGVHTVKIRVKGAATNVWGITFENQNNFLPEDVNRDGLVNSLDVLKVYKFMQTSTGEETGMIEDVNGDGLVNSLDVLKVYKYMQSH